MINIVFFAKTQKALRFDALIEKRVFFTYVQARTSQHRIIQLNHLDLSCGGDQGMYANLSRVRPRLSLGLNRVTKTSHVRWCGIENNPRCDVSRSAMPCA
jgi:hypothetical protein